VRQVSHIAATKWRDEEERGLAAAATKFLSLLVPAKLATKPMLSTDHGGGKRRL